MTIFRYSIFNSFSVAPNSGPQTRICNRIVSKTCILGPSEFALLSDFGPLADEYPTTLVAGTRPTLAERLLLVGRAGALSPLRAGHTTAV